MTKFDPDRIHPVSTVKTKLGLDTNIAATLCYLPFFAVNFISAAVWLFSEPKDNRFLRFHAAQAVVFAGGYFALCFALWLGSLIPLIGPVFGLTLLLLIGAFFLTNFFLMYAAYQKRLVRLPIIADMADRLLETIER